jgi:hypothetical protein
VRGRNLISKVFESEGKGKYLLFIDLAVPLDERMFVFKHIRYAYDTDQKTFVPAA